MMIGLEWLRNALSTVPCTSKTGLGPQLGGEREYVFLKFLGCGFRANEDWVDIHSFSKYLLDTGYRPGMVSAAGTLLNRIDLISAHMELPVLVGGTPNNAEHLIKNY